MIALLHQYQRPVKSDTRRGRTKQYVEVSLADIETANQLANEVLGRSSLILTACHDHELKQGQRRVSASWNCGSQQA